MTSRTPAAGGFFLILALFIGLGWGLAAGRMMQGLLLGTLAGIAIAVTVWLVDRRKAG
jgi:hypothetical protein